MVDLSDTGFYVPPQRKLAGARSAVTAQLKVSE